MNKPRLTVPEALQLLWREEFEDIPDPIQILRLMWVTLYYGVIYVLFEVFPNALIRLAHSLHEIGKQLVK